MSRKIILFFALLVLITGCALQQPQEQVQPPILKDGADQIVKEALPDLKGDVVTEKPAEVKEAVEVPKADIFARITVNEGDLVKLDLDATDPDGDGLTYTFSSPLDAGGKWQTQFGDAGQYPVTITASDGKLETTKQILIVVKVVNLAPELSGAKDYVVKEGELVTIQLEAIDPNNDKLTWIVSPPFDDSGKWQTEIGDRGEYRASVKVTDGELSDEASFKVTVIAINRPPILELNTNIKVKEGEIVDLAPKVSDPDGDDITLTYTGWITQDTYQTSFGDAGKHKVTITASDGMHQESVVIWVTVEDVNRPPEIHGLIIN